MYVFEGKKFNNIIKSCKKSINYFKNRSFIFIEHSQVICHFFHIRYIVIEKEIVNILIKTYNIIQEPWKN